MDVDDILIYWSTRLALVEFRSWVAVSFLPIAALFCFALFRADRDPNSSFKLVHFVTSDTGRGSYTALGYTVLVVVCAWGVWALIVLKELTEWYMTLIIGGFILGTLGGRGLQVLARVKGAQEPAVDAGDSDVATDKPKEQKHG